MKNTVGQTLIYSAVPLIVVIEGCGRPTKFSRVMDGGFDLVGEFRRHGYAVQTETHGEGIRNAY